MIKLNKNLNIKRNIVAYLVFFAIIFLFFLLNNILFIPLGSIFGIHPRDFSLMSIIQIMMSWSVHGNWQHLIGNVSILIFLMFIPYFFEKHPNKIILSLIFLSGLLTWALGSSNSVHIGASGLIFSIFGYSFSSLLINKKFIYLIPVSLLSYFYYQAIIKGLIPQENISFSAHMGGFISGIILSYLFYRMDKKEMTIKWRLK